MQYSFMFTFSGRRVDLPVPLPGQVLIDDIAVHLARMPRFSGATRVPRSVAAHSMHVADLAEAAGAPAAVQLAALLHDAHEAYSGDQTSPWKRAVAGLAGRIGVPCTLRTAEHMVQKEVMQQLGAWDAFKTAERSIKQWDLVSLMTERRDLAPSDSLREHWAGLDHITPDPAPIPSHRGMTWEDLAMDFLERHRQLAIWAGAEATMPAGAPAATTATTATTINKESTNAP